MTGYVQNLKQENARGQKPFRMPGVQVLHFVARERSKEQESHLPKVVPLGNGRARLVCQAATVCGPLTLFHVSFEGNLTAHVKT